MSLPCLTEQPGAVRPTTTALAPDYVLVLRSELQKSAGSDRASPAVSTSASSSSASSNVGSDSAAMVVRMEPSAVQKAALAFLPAGMVAREAARSKRKSKGKKHVSYVPDGKTVSKAFNPNGSRPYPALVSLEETLNATLERTNFQIMNSTTVVTYGANYFQLSDCSNYTEYTGLLDQYLIREVEVWIEPNNPYAGNTPSGVYYSCVDLDDANTPGSTVVVSGKAGALASGFNAGHYHRWRPHTAVAEYSGAFTSYGNVPSTWIDSASPNVQHYGLKYVFPASTTQTTFTFSARVHVIFRAPNV